MSAPSSNQHGSASCWPFLDYNNPVSCLLQEELLLQPPAFMSSKSDSPSSPSPSPSPSLSPTFNPSQLLQSKSSMGASTTKVSKRKSRAVTKPPIRVLSADRATFREMVQKLTGIPTSPSLQAGRLWGSNPSAIFRPMAARPGSSSQGDFMAAAHQTMPTLDTSSAYLTRGVSHNNLMYNDVGNNARFNSSYEASYSARDGAGMGSYKGVAYGEGGNTSGGADTESMRGLHHGSELESLYMGSNKHDDLLLTRMDPWLISSDLIHTPTSHVEIAHSA